MHLQEEFHGIGHSTNSSSSSVGGGGGDNDCGDTGSYGDTPGRVSSTAVIEAVTRSAVLVAMHPDQATGAVLETALALHKPFAIVPCCVFPRLFPQRLTPTGRTVCSYEELCDWIQAQDPQQKIQRAALPFHGRNVVLYRL